jgi:predicted nucleic acid-binding protein
MMCVLLDTDVVLDYLLDRAPFAAAASVIWQAGEQGRLEIFVPAITPINVFYIARKLKGEALARSLTESLVTTARTCTLDHMILTLALASPMRDYEDAVQATSADAYQLDGIVTRNFTDYERSPVPVLSPEDVVSRL